METKIYTNGIQTNAPMSEVKTDETFFEWLMNKENHQKISTSMENWKDKEIRNELKVRKGKLAFSGVIEGDLKRNKKNVKFIKNPILDLDELTDEYQDKEKLVNVLEQNLGFSFILWESMSSGLTNENGITEHRYKLAAELDEPIDNDLHQDFIEVVSQKLVDEGVLKEVDGSNKQLYQMQIAPTHSPSNDMEVSLHNERKGAAKVQALKNDIAHKKVADEIDYGDVDFSLGFSERYENAEPEKVVNDFAKKFADRLENERNFWLSAMYELNHSHYVAKEISFTQAKILAESLCVGKYNTQGDKSSVIEDFESGKFSYGESPKGLEFFYQMTNKHLKTSENYYSPDFFPYSKAKAEGYGSVASIDTESALTESEVKKLTDLGFGRSIEVKAVVYMNVATPVPKSEEVKIEVKTTKTDTITELVELKESCMEKIATGEIVDFGLNEWFLYFTNDDTGIKAMYAISPFAEKLWFNETDEMLYMYPENEKITPEYFEGSNLKKYNMENLGMMDKITQHIQTRFKTKTRGTYPKTKIMEAVISYAKEHNAQNAVNSAIDLYKQLIASGERDEVNDNTFLEFFEKFGDVSETPYALQALMNWIKAIVIRNRSGDFLPKKYDDFLILHGGQGAGKSTLAAKMAFGYFSDSVKVVGSMATGADKDSEGQRTRLVGVEVAELTAIKDMKSQEEFKQWIARSSVRYRPPYEKFEVERPIRSIPIGTTNKSEGIATDLTGNRRQWVISIETVPRLTTEEVIRLFVWAHDAMADDVAKGKVNYEGLPIYYFTKEESDKYEAHKRLHYGENFVGTQAYSEFIFHALTQTRSMSGIVGKHETEKFGEFIYPIKHTGKNGLVNAYEDWITRIHHDRTDEWGKEQTNEYALEYPEVRIRFSVLKSEYSNTGYENFSERVLGPLKFDHKKRYNSGGRRVPVLETQKIKDFFAIAFSEDYTDYLQNHIEPDNDKEEKLTDSKKVFPISNATKKKKETDEKMAYGKNLMAALNNDDSGSGTKDGDLPF